MFISRVGSKEYVLTGQLTELSFPAAEALEKRPPLTALASRPTPLSPCAGVTASQNGTPV
jgi:hypothetical protein